LFETDFTALSDDLVAVVLVDALATALITLLRATVLTAATLSFLSVSFCILA
jgi:hypothetical protein